MQNWIDCSVGLYAREVWGLLGPAKSTATPVCRSTSPACAKAGCAGTRADTAGHHHTTHSSMLKVKSHSNKRTTYVG